ncbi:MAG: zinc-binding dehydrogenase, partial [Solirubrobacteraceae bacterium]
LGVAPERIAAIAAGPTPPGGARAAWGADAEPGALPRIADAIVAGQITVPIAARFPIEQIREATALQADRHVHSKIVVNPLAGLCSQPDGGGRAASVPR